MPTILRINGIRFFFYSNEGNEPAHIHVMKGDADGKIWLNPEIRIAYLYGFSSNEEREILSIAFENENYFKLKWDEFFNK